MMRSFLTIAIVAVLASSAVAESKKINLRSKEGVATVKGEWRYSDVRLVEVPSTAPDKNPPTTYNYEPRATGPEFDDSKWPVIDPASLGKRRAGGLICFAWYRIKVTIPADAEGKRVYFQTNVDDYGEVWVDGKLPFKVGKTGEAIVAGFNTPNRLELKGAKPGKTYQIAVFGINGPISATPGNGIFLSDTFLEIVD